MRRAEYQPDEDERALLDLLPADGSAADSNQIRSQLDRMPSAMRMPAPAWKNKGMYWPGVAAMRPFAGI